MLHTDNSVLYLWACDSEALMGMSAQKTRANLLHTDNLLLYRWTCGSVGTDGDVSTGPHLLDRPTDEVDLQLPAISLRASLGFCDVCVEAHNLEEQDAGRNRK